MKLTPEQVGALWILAGGPREATADAIGEAYVESGFETTARSSVGALGLWQLHPTGTTDPLANARGAVAKYRDGGNSFAKHWHAWQGPGTAAKRAAYMPRAYAAAGRITRMDEKQLRAVVGGRTAPALFGLPTPDLPSPTDPLGPLGPSIPDILGGGGGGIPNPLDGLGDLGASIGNIAEILRGFLETWLEWMKKITDPQTWVDAGKILLGFILLTIGLKRLFTISTN